MLFNGKLHEWRSVPRHLNARLKFTALCSVLSRAKNKKTKRAVSDFRI